MKPGHELDALVAEKPYKCRACGNTEYKLMGGKRCCYVCHRRHGEEWRKANPEKHNKTMRTPEGKIKSSVYRGKWGLRKRYGMTINQYIEMAKMQDGRCVICRKQTTSTLHVDHCHTTGKVRGLLCNRCNVGLSNFSDDIGIMRNAIRYLELAALKVVGLDVKKI